MTNVSAVVYPELPNQQGVSVCVPGAYITGIDTPGFDVIDYGQEDYVFGNEEQDARHWSIYVLEAMRDHAEELAPHF